ncbi:serine hydrolase domain-containing protein [Kitasatospora sp. NPDC006697]|uniref:serine hydrolase domain-containing protein n=1 Tax=Kitasatospora sp. NPDC006697 TaxID=3364020 RepID=UPI00369BA2A4
MKLTIRAAVLTAAAALLATAAAAPAGAAPVPAGTGAGHGGVQSVLDRAVAEAGLPGATALVQDGRGGSWFGRAGVDDLATGAQPRRADRFRIGSTTKTFVATVMLQLVAEQRVGLDDPVEQWLPGLVDGNGYDGSRITVRQLLGQTSGIYNYVLTKTMLDDATGTPFLQHRFDHYSPEQLVRLALTSPPAFAPGTGWGYSDTNYVLAGLIIERATGHALAQEIEDRIVRPLHLTATYEPTGDTTGIKGPHGRGYSHLYLTGTDVPAYDVTELNPSWGFAAGDMVSDAKDLNTFVGALLAGRLLPPAEQREMLATQPTVQWIPDTEYGLGLASVKLSCGTTVQGMGGAIEGSWSYTFGTPDGRHLLTTHVNGDWANGSWFPNPITLFTAELNAEFCGTGS